MENPYEKKDPPLVRVELRRDKKCAIKVRLYAERPETGNEFCFSVRTFAGMYAHEVAARFLMETLDKEWTE